VAMIILAHRKMTEYETIDAMEINHHRVRNAHQPAPHREQFSAFSPGRNR